MLHAELAVLERRQKILETELVEAQNQPSGDNPMVAYLKSRALYVREEVERLRYEKIRSYH